MTTVFDTYLHHLATGFDWTSATVKGMLVNKNAWAPAKGDPFVASILAAGAVEVTSASYVREAIATPTATTDGTGHRELLDSAIFDFGNLEASVAYDTFVLFCEVTTDADSWLMLAVDLGAQATDGSDVQVVPNAAGVFELIQP